MLASNVAVRYHACLGAMVCSGDQDGARLARYASSSVNYDGCQVQSLAANVQALVVDGLSQQPESGGGQAMFSNLNTRQSLTDAEPISHVALACSIFCVASAAM